MKSVTDRIKKGARNLAIFGAVAGGLAFWTQKVEAQNQLRVFSPKHVTADNPQGIVTGGYTSQTANYEYEIGRLRNTSGTWYGDQVANPFIRPGYRDKDMGEREYYGSKDVNGNHVINELADVQAIQDGNTSYKGDVNADGVTNSTDAGLIQSVINETIPYAPSDWNYLAKQEKIDYFEKLKPLDDTDYYREGWVCNEYANRFWLKFAGLEKAKEMKSEEYTFAYLLQLIDFSTYTNENGFFNLPVYKVITTAKNGEKHAIDAILVGDDPLNFDEWYFIEPQMDTRVFPGDFSMRNNEGDMVKIERLCYFYNEVLQRYEYNTLAVVRFDLHNDSSPTLAWKTKYLVASRPPNPVSGIDDIVNPSGKPTLSVFPNPVKRGQDFNIVNSTGQFDETGRLEVLDLMGKTVCQLHLNGITDDYVIFPACAIGSLPQGQYILRYLGHRKNISTKFLIMND